MRPAHARGGPRGPSVVPRRSAGERSGGDRRQGALLYSRSSSLFPRRQVVAVTRPRRAEPTTAVGSRPPLGALAASPDARRPAARGSRTAAHYRIRPLPGLRVRRPTSPLRVLGADAGQPRTRAASTRTRVHRTTRPATCTCSGRSASSRGALHGPQSRGRPSSSSRDAHRHRSVATCSTGSVRGWAWPRRRAERLGSAAAALYVFNPVSFYDSALWGQTDAAGALVLLLGVAALIRGNSEGATALAAMAALVKPQFGVVLVPLVGVVLLKRHLLQAGLGPAHAPWAPPARGMARRASRAGPARIVAGGRPRRLPCRRAPVRAGHPGLPRLMGRNTAGGYEYLTVNAFNPWALVGSRGIHRSRRRCLWQSTSVPGPRPVPRSPSARRCCRRLPVGLWNVRRSATTAGPSSSRRSCSRSPSSCSRRASTSATSSRRSRWCRCSRSCRGAGSWRSWG